MIQNVFCFSACPKCARDINGTRTCCGKGGSWEGKCGMPGDLQFNYTWGEGVKACVTSATSNFTTLQSTVTASLSKSSEPMATTTTLGECPRYVTNPRLITTLSPENHDATSAFAVHAPL